MRRDCYRNSKQKYCSGTRITDRTASDICLEKESYTVSDFGHNFLLEASSSRSLGCILTVKETIWRIRELFDACLVPRRRCVSLAEHGGRDGLFEYNRPTTPRFYTLCPKD